MNLKAIGHLGKHASRAGYAFADSAVQSASNFAVGLVAVRLLNSEALGAYATAFAVLFFLTGLVRAATGEVLVFTPPSSESDNNDRLRGAVSTSSAAALIATVVMLAVALVLHRSPVGGTLAIVALVSVGVFAQDAFRFGAFSVRNPRRALTLDLVVFVGQLVMMALVAWTRPGQPWVILLAGSTPAFVQGVWLMLNLKGIRWPLVRDWVSEHHHLVRPFMGEFLITSGVATLLPAFVSPIIGLAGVGQIRAGQMLLGPINVITGGILPHWAHHSSVPSTSAAAMSGNKSFSLAAVCAWSCCCGQLR